MEETEIYRVQDNTADGFDGGECSGASKKDNTCWSIVIIVLHKFRK